MHTNTLDLGYCSFTRPKAHVYAIAQAKASYSPAASCSALNLSPPSLESDYLCWFSTCPNLQICLSVTLNHNLHLVVGKTSLIEQTLLRSFEQAQLWSQLGLRARFTAAEWSSTSHASTLTLNLSATSSYTTSDGSSRDYDASCVQPPAIVVVHRFNAVHLSMHISNTMLGDGASDTMNNMNTTLEISSEDCDFVQGRNEKINRIPANHISECFGLPQTGTVVKRSAKTSHSDCKIILSLVDTCFRKFIWSDSRAARGVNPAQDSQLMSLASLAPSVFIPEHGQKLFHRAHLVQPMARFLAAFRSRSATRSISQKCTGSPDSSVELGNQDADHDISRTREVYAGNLWLLMSQALAAKKSGNMLKPLSFDGDHTEVRQDPLDPQCDILDDDINEEDEQSFSLVDRATGDISLFDIYSAQMLGDSRMDGFQCSKSSACERQDIPAEPGTAIASEIEPFEEISLPSDRSRMGICRMVSGNDIDFSRGQRDDNDTLQEPIFFLDEHSLTFFERHKVTQREESGKLMAERGPTSPASLSSMIMVDDDNEIDSMAWRDDDLQNMLDVQQSSSSNGYGETTDLLFDHLQSTVEGGGSPGNAGGNFAARNAFGHPDVLQVNSDDHSALLTEYDFAESCDGSLMSTSIGESMQYRKAWTTDTMMPSRKMDSDHDMINEQGQAYDEGKEEDNAFMDIGLELRNG